MRCETRDTRERTRHVRARHARVFFLFWFVFFDRFFEGLATSVSA